ncbi:MAG: YfhO family protein [Bacteroidales bacterium]|nr:YfhO family protein [Bacteroidales bacterium]MCF8337144.1 YfhO family protein [Bacteroidales bacterium]
MKNIDLKQFFPHITALVIFLLIAVMYMNPVLSGKKVQQGDIANYKGMSKEIRDFRSETGEEPLWTNSMFGGMPSYQISTKYPSNLIKEVDKFLRLGLPRPADYLWLNMLGFFILLLAMRVNPWMSIVGAIAYAFSSYFFIIIEAGHNSKAHAMTYMAPVLAGVILTYRGKYLLGGILTILFVSLEVSTNHLQITYYLIIILIILGIGELIHHAKKKQFPHFLKATGILLVAALIAVGPNITSILLTQQYSEHTIRGESELSTEKENRTSGLDKDYATRWSYGKEETFTLMIPNTKGGASGRIGQDPDNLKNVDNQRLKQIIGQQNHYWGNQPFTSGPVYVGAIIVFLFILGLFIVKGRLKWILLVATILSVMLAWGDNMMWFTDFWLEHVPGYNKFRTVSMTLVIAELCMPILAFMGLYKIYKNPGIFKEKRREFLIALGLTAGVSLILYLLPQTFFNFISEQEVNRFNQLKNSQPQNANQINLILEELKSVRVDIFKADAIRSFFFIILGAGLIYLYSLKKIKAKYLILGLGILITIDMWAVNKRYLNNDDFVNKRVVNNPFQPTKADKQIMKDNDPNFRVFNTTVNTFNDASTSYFHKSIGGYHGAKLRRYQELIDYHISEQNQDVLNMLNTKYFIVKGNNGKPVAKRNPGALGNAWFVEEYEIVADADEEINALDDFNPEQTAFVDKRFKDHLNGKAFEKDPNASIELTDYKPNHLVYQSKTNKEQLAVFSEIYYPNGWQVYIDGEPADHFRVNYVLRAMVVPEGEHKIEFKFQPKTYYTGENIALVSSIILFILVIGGLYLEIRKGITKSRANE